MEGDLGGMERETQSSPMRILQQDPRLRSRLVGKEYLGITNKHVDSLLVGVVVVS